MKQVDQDAETAKKTTNIDSYSDSYRLALEQKNTCSYKTKRRIAK